MTKPILLPISSITYSRPRSRQRILSDIDYPGIIETTSPLFIYLETTLKKLNKIYAKLVRENPDRLLQKLQALQQKLYKIIDVLQSIRLSSTLPRPLTISDPNPIPKTIQRPFQQLSSLFSHLDRTAHHEFFKKIRIQTEKIMREATRLDDQVIHTMRQLQAPTQIQRQQTVVSTQSPSSRLLTNNPDPVVQINQIASVVPPPRTAQRNYTRLF